MADKTLADRIRNNFSLVKLNNVLVKVPKAKNRKASAKKLKQKTNKADENPPPSVVSILLKSAVADIKKDKKEKPLVEQKKSYAIEKNEEKTSQSGGYGTISKHYGSTPHSSYVDYQKLFSYLGKFRAKGAYESSEATVAALNNSLENGSFALADKDTIEKGARYVKYMKHPTIDIAVSAFSLVPQADMSSSEWEHFRLFMQLDPVMYMLKSRTS